MLLPLFLPDSCMSLSAARNTEKSVKSESKSSELLSTAELKAFDCDERELLDGSVVGEEGEGVMSSLLLCLSWQSTAPRVHCEKYTRKITL